jgi:hypothetical protein
MSNGRGLTLPGGYWSGQRLEKAVTLRGLDGYAEQALLEARQISGPTPRRVSALLGILIEQLGEQPFDSAVADGLCVADRQWLMLQLARRMKGERVWLTARCSVCSASFDIPIDLSHLPVKPSGESYPEPQCKIQDRRVGLRVPTGLDQLTSLEATDPSQAKTRLLKVCVVSVDGEPVAEDWFESLDDGAITQIEETLEQASPAVGTTLSLDCPECGANQIVRLNLYGLLDEVPDGLLEQVHLLAWHYHWSEHDILALTRQRRHSYLQLIDRARGMVV